MAKDQSPVEFEIKRASTLTGTLHLLLEACVGSRHCNTYRNIDRNIHINKYKYSGNLGSPLGSDSYLTLVCVFDTKLDLFFAFFFFQPVSLDARTRRRVTVEYSVVY